MALNIGELVGFIGLDSKGFDDALDKAGEKLKTGNGGKFKAAAIAGGVAIGVALGAGVVGAMDVQDGQAKLAAQLGLTSQQAAHFGKVAGQVYSANWGESLEEVNESIALITKNIGEGNDAWLKDTSAKVLAFSSTFGTDMQMLTQDIAALLNNGLAKSSDEALDILTAGMTNGANKADDLLETFQEYPVQFAKLGLSGQQAMGLLSQGLQAGARDSDIVADAFKEFSIRAVDGSTSTAAGFTAIGLSADVMAERIGKGGQSANDALDETLDRLRAIPDPVKRSQAAVNLFGTQAEDLGAALFALDPSSAVDALGQVGGAAQKMADTVGTTASGNIESFKRQLQTTFTTVVGAVVIPALTKVTGWFSSRLGPAIDGVTNFYREHESEVKAVATVLGVVAGAIGVVIAVTKAWAIAQAVMNAVLTANPIGIVVVALAAMVAGIVIAYNKIAWFRDLVNGVWAVLKTGFTVAAGVISSIYHGVIQPVWAAFSAAVQDLWLKAQPAIAWLSAKWDELSAKIQLLWVTRIQPALVALGNSLQTLWADYGQKLADWWNEHWPAMAAAIQAAWTNYIQPALGALFAALGWVVDYVQKHWPEISATIKIGADMIGQAFSILGAIISAAWSVISAIWATMQATWSAISSVIRASTVSIGTAFTAVGAAAKAAWTVITTAWAGATAWFSGLKGNITGALSDAGTWLLDTGRNIVTGLVSGIQGAAGWLKDQVISIVKAAIPAPIRKVLGINSPSRVMAEQVGQWIPKGIAMGIQDHAGVVDAAMRELVDVPTLTIPTPGAGARGGARAGGPARGGDGAAAATTAGTYIAKQIHQENYIAAGWSAREADAYLSLKAGKV